MQEEDLERIHRPFFVWLACQKGISEGESRRGTDVRRIQDVQKGRSDRHAIFSGGLFLFLFPKKRKEEKVNPPIFFLFLVDLAEANPY